jgi:hypothetical protein
METSLALQKVLLVTVSLARLLHAERRHGVSSCLDRVDRVLYLLRCDALQYSHACCKGLTFRRVP